MKTEHEFRDGRKEKHPVTLLLSSRAYDLMIEALDVVNARMGLPPPQDKLYSFKGVKLRRARENERG